MTEIFYKTFYGSTTVVISVAERDDKSVSFSIAKYADKSKSEFISHQQFSLTKENFELLITDLNNTLNDRQRKTIPD
jgi:hypothetical protein